ncbi:helix-turn-helix transcriptional regulator [Paenarthrobacter nicotinovorans]|uniref:helix-turn-helix transcriptional regulator n=1 Tax=Paenarthrobacter nicotinovorans TaxID=29320 RepID=UPI003A81007B
MLHDYVEGVSMTTPSIPKLLTLPEVAERLRKSPAQIRWMIHVGSAPKSALIGGRRMVRESDLADYINQAFEQSVA